MVFGSVLCVCVCVCLGVFRVCLAVFGVVLGERPALIPFSKWIENG